MSTYSPSETEKDFLTDEEVVGQRRSSLIPWWQHLLMVLLMGMEVLACIGIISGIVQADPRTSDTRLQQILIMVGIVGILILCSVAGKILIWCRWKHAVAFTLPSASLLSAGAILMVTFLGIIKEQSEVSGIFSPYLLLNGGLAVRLIFMLRDWKSLPR